MFRHRPIQSRSTSHPQSNKHESNTEYKYDNSILNTNDNNQLQSTSTACNTTQSSHTHRDRERSYNSDRHGRSNINFLTDSDEYHSERDIGLDNPHKAKRTNTQNIFDIKRDVNTLSDPSYHTLPNNSIESAYNSSGLTHYGVSTFHLHPPANDTGVWDFEAALFEPATLSICEGERTYCLTVIPNVGFRKQDLKLSVQSDMLVVHGHRDREFEWNDDKGHAPSRRRIPLSFTRYIPLPNYVEHNNMQAVYYRWKLHIYVNKKNMNINELNNQLVHGTQQRLQNITISDYESVAPAEQSLITASQSDSQFQSNNTSRRNEPLPINASLSTI